MDQRLQPAPPDADGLARQLRRWILEQSYASNVGHIGSALSITDIMAVLWRDVLHEPASQHPDRDRFVLGKGHAALALYAALRWKGLISEADFRSYCQDGSLFAVHPEYGVPSVEVATGSLGQGLSVGCGLALSLKQRGSTGRVFVLVSDAECNEGQVWEAIMFAAHHRLDNLIAIVDLNGLQAMGETRQVLNLAPMDERWRAFGWQAIDVNGHHEAALKRAFLYDLADRDRPAVVVAHTHLGHGVRFMENRVEWHYRNLDAAGLEQALREVGGRP